MIQPLFKSANVRRAQKRPGDDPGLAKRSMEERASLRNARRSLFGSAIEVACQVWSVA